MCVCVCVYVYVTNAHVAQASQTPLGAARPPGAEERKKTPDTHPSTLTMPLQQIIANVEVKPGYGADFEKNFADNAQTVYENGPGGLPYQLAKGGRTPRTTVC